MPPSSKRRRGTPPNFNFFARASRVGVSVMVSVPDPAVLTAAFPSLPRALKREMRSNHAGELGAVWISDMLRPVMPGLPSKFQRMVVCLRKGRGGGCPVVCGEKFRQSLSAIATRAGAENAFVARGWTAPLRSLRFQRVRKRAKQRNSHLLAWCRSRYWRLFGM